MSNIEKVVFCDVQENAERLAKNLENAEAEDSLIYTSDSDEEIKIAARQLRIANTKYSIAQVESHD